MKTLSDLIAAFEKFTSGFGDSQKLTKERDDAKAAQVKAEADLAAANTAKATAETNLQTEQAAHNATKETLKTTSAELTEAKAKLADPAGAAAQAVAVAAAAAGVKVENLPAGGEANAQTGVKAIVAKIKAAKPGAERFNLLAAHYNELQGAGVTLEQLR